MQRTKDFIELRTANPADRVALRGVHLRARLGGMSCKATLEQTFVNLEPHAIEAVYTFPLPEGAAVCGFEVITGDRVLTGKIEEAEEAVQQYEQAVSEGHGAFVVEQERPDVFTARVGNLKPRQAATIRLTYVCPLELADKNIRVAFPTTIAPRYATATGTDPLNAAIDGDALNPPHVLTVPYGLSLEVDVALGRHLRAITSPSHAIHVTAGEEGNCRITLTGGVAEMDRDLVLSLEMKKEIEPCVQVSRGREGESYLAVTLVPEFDVDELTAPRAAETVFLLDCSGSMQGDSIAQASAALELCLRSMSPGDTFNICRFGSTWEQMASEPLVYSQQTLDRAIQYVRQGADLGGTELYAPLQAILAQAPRSGSIRNVILLTDGQVTNEPAVIELVRQHRAHNRIFSFGIGSACSAFLVKGVARGTGGAAEFITAGERIDDKVLRTFGRLASPPVTDVRIDWDGAEVQTLAELPPVFDGDVLAIFGRSPATPPKKVTLSCLTAAGPRKWSVAVPPPSEDDGVIATMWARRTIQSLEEVNGVTADRARPAKGSRECELLVNLSKQFGLLCSLTTFIAVEHRSLAERNEGKPELRRVPVKLAAGWGEITVDQMMRGGACVAMSAASAAPAPAQAPMRRRTLLSRAFGVGGGGDKAKKQEAVAGKMSEMRADAGAPAPAKPSINAPSGAASYGGTGLADLNSSVDDFDFDLPADQAFAASIPEPEDGLMDLLTQQSASGSFSGRNSIEDLIRSAGNDPNKWLEAIAAAIAATGVAKPSDELTRTVVSLLLLQTHYVDRESLWRRAARKAVQSFLATAIGKPAVDVETWLEELAREVKA